MSKVLSRTSAGLLAAVAVAGLTLVAPPAASATTCTPKATVTPSGGTVVGRGYTMCRGVPGGEPVTITFDDVVVQRIDPNTGVWHTVATGFGIATYTCLGTATNTFRAATPDLTTASVTASCG